MNVWQIFLLYFLKFGTLDGSLFYQQLYMLGMECGNSITSHIISGSTRIVKSRIECAAHCLITTSCGTILFDSKIEYGQKGSCTLVTEASTGNPYVLESNSSVCFMKKVSVETTQSRPTEAATTPTTLNTSTTMLTTPTTTSLTTTTTTTTTLATSTPAATTTTLSPTTPAPTTQAPTTPAPPQSATTTTTPAQTTTTTTSTSMGETIIDIIDNLYNMCTTNSQNDIAIVTTNGVHLYDDAASLTTGACRNMTNAELFQGFVSLPDKSTWKALLTYFNYYDLITDADQVYRWLKINGSIVPVPGYPKTKKAYIADAVLYVYTNIFNGTQWVVYTHLTGAMTFYFFDASTIYYYRNQLPHEGSFSISDTTNMDRYGKPLNLWYNLPSNVVGVTGQENTNNFTVVDVNLNVYSYHLPDPYNVNTSPPVCVLQGQLRL
ncbi:mucin-3A-like [Magallana gigas]|uniref:mucin-3A-like n=1 Tax=Magallana gigas TaxID=29159 RepID=UPI003342C013